jgi:hypothetical protein
VNSRPDIGFFHRILVFTSFQKEKAAGIANKVRRVEKRQPEPTSGAARAEPARIPAINATRIFL